MHGDATAGTPSASTTTAAPASPWLTVPEAAQRARVGARTVYNAINAGQLRAAKIGARGQFRILEAWCDSWLEACAAPVVVSAQRRRA